MNTADDTQLPTATDGAPAARTCRYCAAPLPPASPRGGMPRIRCSAWICRRRHEEERRQRVLVRRWRAWAERRGDVTAVAKFDAKLAALTPERQGVRENF
jgi:hypothetical protein